MEENHDNRDEIGGKLDDLIDSPHLADALESDRFKQFLDQIPMAIAVAELLPEERLVYANFEFERLVGVSADGITGQAWDVLDGAAFLENEASLGTVVTEGHDHVGTFALRKECARVNVWSNVIKGDEGPAFRLVVLAPVPSADDDQENDSLQAQLAEKDVLLHELQHRVKNNLQMVTALIRLEARNVPYDAAAARFETLAGRVETLAMLYRTLSAEGAGEEVDLGIYLSQIAAAVMSAHATEGVRLDLKVDAWPVSIDVAMPTGLVVNELLTNALKHAFEGRNTGTITVHSLVDADGCNVVIADDGVGLPSADAWPRHGKLSALIVQSLRQNAKANLEVFTEAGTGTRVTIRFARRDAH